MVIKKKKEKKNPNKQPKSCGNGILVLHICIFAIALEKICFEVR